MSMDVLDETALEDLVALGKRKLYLRPPEERREIRRRLKLRQADIARLVGVAPITVSAWENGRSEPRGEPLMNYITVLQRLRQAAGEIADEAG